MPKGRWVTNVGYLTNKEMCDIIQPSNKQYKMNVFEVGGKGANL